MNKTKRILILLVITMLNVLVRETLSQIWPESIVINSWGFDFIHTATLYYVITLYMEIFVKEWVNPLWLLLSALVLPFVLETLQIFGFENEILIGIFDWWDYVAYTLGGLTALSVDIWLRKLILNTQTKE